MSKNCKNCSWLTETIFKRNGLTIFYCNNLKSNSEMEKNIDFTICNKFNNKSE